jgi:hypothetical protein
VNAYRNNTIEIIEHRFSYPYEADGFAADN